MCFLEIIVHIILKSKVLAKNLFVGVVIFFYVQMDFKRSEFFSKMYVASLQFKNLEIKANQKIEGK